jgi:uncharacterized protein
VIVVAAIFSLKFGCTVMLLKFEFSNFCSFRDKAELSLIPTREKLHRAQHIYSLDEEDGPEVLRAAVIYGENASGKSNFIRALEFAKRFITRGVRPNKLIGSTIFKLDESYQTKPSVFHFEILAEGTIYKYEFSLSHDQVLYESLSALSKNTYKLVFERFADEKTPYKFGSFLQSLSKEEQMFYKFNIEGTRKNQLFLTESMERNFTKFSPIYNWFDKSLKIFTPQSINHGVEFQLQDDQKFTTFLKSLLSRFDPSVIDLKTDFVDPETILGIPQKLLMEIKEELGDRQAVFVNNPITGNRMVLFRDEKGMVKLVKIFTQHKCSQSDDLVTFDLEEESDGTRRIIELAPLFYELMASDSNTVACIDELDRSLHPGITTKLIYDFLINNKTKSQLIVSTHDTNLLNTKLLRRDVIWFIHKVDGASQLTSLHKEFNPRHDKDIRREYLEGKYSSGRSYEYEL